MVVTPKRPTPRKGRVVIIDDDGTAIGGDRDIRGLLPRPDPTERTKLELQSEITHLRELLESRLAAMDKAVILLQERADKHPTALEIVARFEEHFAKIDLRFEERDKRYDSEFVKLSTTGRMMMEQQALSLAATKEAVAVAMAASEKAVIQLAETTALKDVDNKRAIDAALEAAKEAVRIQQDFNDKAIQKQEAAFTKQIDQIGSIINSQAVTLDDKIADIRTRLSQAETRIGSSGIMGYAGVGAAVIAIFVLVIGFAFMVMTRPDDPVPVYQTRPLQLDPR